MQRAGRTLCVHRTRKRLTSAPSESDICDGLIRYLSRDELRKTRNEVKLISQTLSVELLDRIRSSLKGSEDEQSTGQGSHPDYDPVNVRSTVQEIASLQEKLQATHDEGEQCALEEDITGKILWFYWRGIRSEVDQLLPKMKTITIVQVCVRLQRLSREPRVKSQATI
ncbi:hypothetical protein EDC04DRAFT_111735 [Pisolithus marmoratus]|nr:hypothetical protein EDC04DRAFT_111735 [Pisolithus marmoratus]